MQVKCKIGHFKKKVDFPEAKVNFLKGMQVKIKMENNTFKEIYDKQFFEIFVLTIFTIVILKWRRILKV